MVVCVSPAGLQGGHFYINWDLTSSSASPELCRHSCPVQSPGYQHQTRLNRNLCQRGVRQSVVGVLVMKPGDSNCLTTYYAHMGFSHSEYTTVICSTAGRLAGQTGWYFKIITIWPILARGPPDNNVVWLCYFSSSNVFVRGTVEPIANNQIQNAELFVTKYWSQF